MIIMLLTPPPPLLPSEMTLTPPGLAAVLTVWAEVAEPPWVAGCLAFCCEGVPSCAVTQACCCDDVPAFQFACSVAVMLVTSAGHPFQAGGGGLPARAGGAAARSGAAMTTAAAARQLRKPRSNSKAHTDARTCLTQPRARFRPR